MLGSSLWAAPVAPNRWFDAERLGRSRAYHAPLVRAAGVRLGLRLVGLALVLVIARAAIAPAEGAGVIAAVGVGAAVAWALWLPQLVIDTWMEYCHEPRFGGATVPADRFAAASVATGTIILGVGALAAVVVYLLVTVTPWWPIVVCAIAASLMVVVGPVGARMAYRSVALDAEIEAELRAVAVAGGVAEVSLGQLSAPVEAGMNAMSLGGRGVPIVLCSAELLRADRDVRDFVVAHEVGHLRRGHHRLALAGSIVGRCAEILSVWLVDRWVLEALDGGVANPRNWPFAVAVAGVTSIPVSLVEAWRSRAHERQADLDASATVGPLGIEALRSLHDHDRSNLDPGRLARVFDMHPPPAERLMRASVASATR